MEWLASLRGKTVGLDTAPVIYYIEKNPSYVALMRAFFESVHKGECSAVTSVLTLLEGLVVPIRKNDTELIRDYHDLLYELKVILTISVFPYIAEEASRLRASYNIRTPDAIQLATAITAGASFFLTNDLALPSLPNIKILTLDDLKKEI
jgi:predicted nucleic acid-binding protein